jgi:hypothetical protein
MWARLMMVEGDRIGRIHGPNSVKNLGHLDGLTIVERSLEYGADLLDPLDVTVEAQIDAALAHLLGERLANVVVKAAQKQLAAIELCGMRA